MAFDFKCSSIAPYPICSFLSTNPITWPIYQFCFNSPQSKPAAAHSITAQYWPFTSHEWPRQNFSLPYQYNINQIGDENKEKYKTEDFLPGPVPQTLRTSIIRIVWQTVKRITYEILGIQGLKRSFRTNLIYSSVCCLCRVEILCISSHCR